MAEHADIWNIPGGDIADAIERSKRLDELCHDIDRDPFDITRSMAIPVDYDAPAAIRETVAGAIDVGFTHIVLITPAQFPDRLAQRMATEIIDPITG